MSTVLLGSEEGPRIETRGDLLLLDHECDSKSTIPSLFAAQEQKLRGLGFGVEGSVQVKENFGSVVFRKENHWLELTGLMLEGVPNLSLRSVRTDRKSPPPVQRPEITRQTSVAQLTEPAVPAVSATPSVSDQDRQPKIVAKTLATAPPGLEQAAMAGISIELALDEKGNIARILSTKGNPGLLGPALQAVRSWTFEPALASGRPVPGILLVDVEFKKLR